MSLILILQENQYIAVDFQENFIEVKTNLLNNDLWQILETLDFNNEKTFVDVGFINLDYLDFRKKSPSEYGRFYEKEDKGFIFVNPYNGKEFNSFY